MEIRQKTYVVYLTTYNGEKLPNFYIGSTNKDKIVNKKYFGTIRSKKWKNIFYEELKNSPHLFKSEIISEHRTRKEALFEENRIQHERNVVNSKDYFNEAYANINGFFGRDVNGKNNPMYGRKNEIIALNKVTEEKLRVSKNEFYNNDNLVGHSLGRLTVIDKSNGEKIKIIKEEFSLNREKYLHFNEGKKSSKKTKEKLSLKHKNKLTVRDWDGNFFVISKYDKRLKNGEVSTISAKRYALTNLDGEIYRLLGVDKFFEFNMLQKPTCVDKNGIIFCTTSVNSKKLKLKSTTGWKLECLDGKTEYIKNKELTYLKKQKKKEEKSYSLCSTKCKYCNCWFDNKFIYKDGKLYKTYCSVRCSNIYRNKEKK